MNAFRQPGLPRLALVCALLMGFVLALLLAASPELHASMHHDAGHGDHQCLAMTLGGGGCEDAVAGPTLAAFISILFPLVPIDGSRQAASLFLSGSVFEHAPPVLS